MHPLEPLLLPWRDRAAAIELRPESGEYDDTLRRSRRRWALQVVLRERGLTDSRYREQRVGTVEEGQWGSTVEGLRALAAAHGLPLALPAEQDVRRAAGSWIATQGAAPEVSWTLVWRGSWWTPDGRPQVGEGEVEVEAASGQQACWRAAPKAAAKLAEETGGAGSLLVELREPPYKDSTRHRVGGAWPVMEDLESVRDLARGGARASALLAQLRPSTPLAGMLVFEKAFEIELRHLDPVAAHLRGELPATALDAAMAPLVLGRETQWNLPWLLRTAVARGEALRPTILRYKAQGVGVLQAIIAVRRAFGFGLAEAKGMVESCCGANATDAYVQKLFESAMGKTPLR